MSTFQRLRNGQRETTWTYKFRVSGHQHVASGFATRAMADDAKRLARRAVAAGKMDAVRAILAPRTVAKSATLAEIFTLYRAAPPSARRASATSREGNIRRLLDLVRLSSPTINHQPESTPLTSLTARLIYDYKQAIDRQAAAEDESRRLQLYRSANSVIIQARSVFTADFCEYYTQIGGLEIPACLAAFRSAPIFKGCKKQEYTPPNDRVIAATFAALARLETEDLNLYKCMWLALGYGLRKSEIEHARNDWFITIDDAPYLSGDELAKNHKFPRIRAQLGAWDKLAPHIKDKPAKDYVITGSDTERSDDVFRRCSLVMKSVGWATQHHVHELRAYAGCQVAMNSPRHIYDAQTFMRHASVTTTEAHYGHHLKRHLDEVKLTLPTPAVFQPTLVQTS